MKSFVSQALIFSLLLNLFFPFFASASSGNDTFTNSSSIISSDIVNKKSEELKSLTWLLNSDNKEEKINKYNSKLSLNTISNKEEKYLDWEVIIKYKNTNLNKLSNWRFTNQSIAYMSNMMTKKESELKSKWLFIKENFKNLWVSHIFSKTKSTRDIIEDLKNDPDIEYVQPNFIYKPLSIDPNDPDYDKLWGLHNEWQVANYYAWYDDVDIDWPEAYEKYTEKWIVSDWTWTIVAVIDTWVFYNHEDLKDNMWNWKDCLSHTGWYLGDCIHWYDFNSLDKNPLPTYSDHGTHVAWTIAASLNNNTWITWVNPNAKIMAVKWFEYSIDSVRAINFAKNNGAKIINASWGWYFLWWHDCDDYSKEPYIDHAMRDAIKDFWDEWWLFIAAAWNWESNHDNISHRMFPAWYSSDFECSWKTYKWLDNIISVAAVDNVWDLAWFSDYWSKTVHLWAPWVDTYSSSYNYVTDYLVDFEDFDTYGSWNFLPEWLSWATATWSSDIPNWWLDDKIYPGDKYKLQPDINNPYLTWFSTSVESKTFDLSWKEYSQMYFRIDCILPDNNNWNDYFSIEFSNDGWLNYEEIQRFDDNWYKYTLFSHYLDEKYLKNDFKFRFNWNSSADDDYTDLGCWIDNFYFLSYHIDDSYNFKNWTSMATPHVAWAASLLWSYDQDLEKEYIKKTLIESWDEYDSLIGKTISWKMLNINNAMDYLYNIDYFDIKSEKNELSIWEDFDLDLSIISNNWRVSETYDWTIYIHSTSDPDVVFTGELSDNLYTFTWSDNWLKSFSWLIKFSKPWKHDISINDLNNSSLNWKIYFDVTVDWANFLELKSTWSPEEKKIFAGASDISYMWIDFTAWNHDIVVDNIKIKRLWTWAINDFDNLWFKTEIWTWNSFDYKPDWYWLSIDWNNLSFNNLSLNISSWETKTLYLYVDHSTNHINWDSNYFELIEVNASSPVASFDIVSDILNASDLKASSFELILDSYNVDMRDIWTMTVKAIDEQWNIDESYEWTIDFNKSRDSSAYMYFLDLYSGEFTFKAEDKWVKTFENKIKYSLPYYSNTGSLKIRWYDNKNKILWETQDILLSWIDFDEIIIDQEVDYKDTFITWSLSFVWEARDWDYVKIHIFPSYSEWYINSEIKNTLFKSNSFSWDNLENDQNSYNEWEYIEYENQLKHAWFLSQTWTYSLDSYPDKRIWANYMSYFVNKYSWEVILSCNWEFSDLDNSDEACKYAENIKDYIDFVKLNWDYSGTGVDLNYDFNPDHRISKLEFLKISYAILNDLDSEYSRYLVNNLPDFTNDEEFVDRMHKYWLIDEIFDDYDTAVKTWLAFKLINKMLEHESSWSWYYENKFYFDEWDTNLDFKLDIFNKFVDHEGDLLDISFYYYSWDRFYRSYRDDISFEKAILPEIKDFEEQDLLISHSKTLNWKIYFKDDTIEEWDKLSLSFTKYFWNFTYNNYVNAANNLASLWIIVDHSDNPDDYDFKYTIGFNELVKILLDLRSSEINTECSWNIESIKDTLYCNYIETALDLWIIDMSDIDSWAERVLKKYEVLKYIFKFYNISDFWKSPYDYVQKAKYDWLFYDEIRDYYNDTSRWFFLYLADRARKVYSEEESEDDLWYLLGDLFWDEEEAIETFLANHGKLFWNNSILHITWKYKELLNEKVYDRFFSSPLWLGEETPLYIKKEFILEEWQEYLDLSLELDGILSDYDEDYLSLTYVLSDSEKEYYDFDKKVYRYYLSFEDTSDIILANPYITWMSGRTLYFDYDSASWSSLDWYNLYADGKMITKLSYDSKSVDLSKYLKVWKEYIIWIETYKNYKNQDLIKSDLETIRVNLPWYEAKFNYELDDRCFWLEGKENTKIKLSLYSYTNDYNKVHNFTVNSKTGSVIVNNLSVWDYYYNIFSSNNCTYWYFNKDDAFEKVIDWNINVGTSLIKAKISLDLELRENNLTWSLVNNFISRFSPISSDTLNKWFVLNDKDLTWTWIVNLFSEDYRIDFKWSDNKTIKEIYVNDLLVSTWSNILKKESFSSGSRLSIVLASWNKLYGDTQTINNANNWRVNLYDKDTQDLLYTRDIKFWKYIFNWIPDWSYLLKAYPFSDDYKIFTSDININWDKKFDIVFEQKADIWYTWYFDRPFTIEWWKARLKLFPWTNNTWVLSFTWWASNIIDSSSAFYNVFNSSWSLIERVDDFDLFSGTWLSLSWIENKNITFYFNLKDSISENYNVLELDFSGTKIYLDIAKLRFDSPSVVKTDEVFEIRWRAPTWAELDLEYNWELIWTWVSKKWFFKIDANISESWTWNLQVIYDDFYSDYRELEVGWSSPILEWYNIKLDGEDFISSDNSNISRFSLWTDTDIKIKSDIELWTTFSSNPDTYAYYLWDHKFDNNWKLESWWSDYGTKDLIIVYTKWDKTFTQLIAKVTILIDPSWYISNSLTNVRVPWIKASLYNLLDKNWDLVISSDWLDMDKLSDYLNDWYNYSDLINDLDICETWEYSPCSWQLFDADSYDQVNPQYTDWEWKYGWDVPEGFYYVRFNDTDWDLNTWKYNDFYSNVSQIPPVVTDLNFSISSTCEMENTHFDLESSECVSDTQTESESNYTRTRTWDTNTETWSEWNYSCSNWYSWDTCQNAPSSGWGWGGGWWSSYPTCKDDQLYCKKLWNTFKYYRKSWERCTRWNLYKVCSINDIDESKIENKSDKTLAKKIVKQARNRKKWIPVFISKNFVKLENNTLKTIYNKYSDKYSNLDKNLSSMLYTSEEIFFIRYNIRDNFKLLAYKLKELEKAYNLSDFKSIKVLTNDLKTILTNLEKNRLEFDKEISNYWTLKIKDFSGEEIYYIKYDNPKLNVFNNVLNKYNNKKVEDKELFKLSNKLLFYISEYIEKKKDLSKSKKNTLKNEIKKSVSNYLSRFEYLENKKTNKSVKKRKTVKKYPSKDKSLSDNNIYYYVNVWSIKLNWNKNFTYTKAWLKKWDKLKFLEKVNNYSLLKLEIVSSYNKDNIWKVGYIYESYLLKK